MRLDHGGRMLEGKLVAAQAAERVTAPQTTSKDYCLTLVLKGAVLQSLWLSDVRRRCAAGTSRSCQAENEIDAAREPIARLTGEVATIQTRLVDLITALAWNNDRHTAAPAV